MSFDALGDRAASSAGVSVGTSIPMETIIADWPVFDPERERLRLVDIKNYNVFLVNIYTLFRNIYNAIGKDGRSSLRADDVAYALVHEIETISQAVNNASSGVCRVLFYSLDYSKLNRYFPGALLRKRETPLQKEQDTLANKVVDLVVKNLRVNSPKLLYTSSTPVLSLPNAERALIFTHIAVDLLNKRRFTSLELLESHTGVVKKEFMWHTKLYNGKLYPTIPFNEVAIQLFGDDHKFSPYDIKVKREMIDMASKYNWSWTTSKSKIQSDLNKHLDKAFVKAMQKFFVTF